MFRKFATLCWTREGAGVNGPWVGGGAVGSGQYNVFIYCNWFVTRWQWVILHVNKTLNWLLLDLSREGYMRSM